MKILKRIFWAEGLLLLALAGLFAAFAAIPGRFGLRVGAGYAAVEHALCALDRDATAGILVAGDSRAKSQVIPSLLAEAAGRRCVNVAEQLNVGGDLPTLVNSLRKHPAVIASAPALLISASADGVNDLSFTNAPMAAVLNFTPLEHGRLLLAEPAGYLAFLSRDFLPFLRREWSHMRKGTGYACEEGMRLPEAIMAELGYRPPPAGPLPGARGQKRRGYLLDGGRRRVFLASLDTLAAWLPGPIVVFQGPADTARLARDVGPEAVAAVRAFSTMAGDIRGRSPKIVFWDFAANPPPGIGPGHFHDAEHLNGEGARLFSRALGLRIAELLREPGRTPGAGAAPPSP